MQRGAFSPRRKTQTISSILELARMKNINKYKEVFSLGNEPLEELRKELRDRISLEELEYALRLEAVDSIFFASQSDPVAFRSIWIQSIFAAGLSREVAIACIADSCLWPN